MMTRAEKLFNIRAQVAKAASDIDHGDTYGACLALGDALSAVLEFLEEELPEKSPIHPVGEEVKEAQPAGIKLPQSKIPKMPEQRRKDESQPIRIKEYPPK